MMFEFLVVWALKFTVYTLVYISLYAIIAMVAQIGWGKKLAIPVDDAIWVSAMVTTVTMTKLSVWAQVGLFFGAMILFDVLRAYVKRTQA